MANILDKGADGLKLSRSNHSKLTSVYLAHQLRLKTGTPTPVHIAIVCDKKVRAVDFGSPNNWAAGIAGRCVAGELQVRFYEVQSVGSRLSLQRISAPNGTDPRDTNDAKAERKKKTIEKKKNEVEVVPVARFGRARSSSYIESFDNAIQDAADETFMSLLMCGEASTQGTRSSMEDESVIEERFDKIVQFFHPETKIGAHLFAGVYDGHDGAEAAHYLGKHLHAILARAHKPGKDFTEPLKDAFATIEKEMNDMKMKSGACGVVAVFEGRSYHIAHVGDCRGVLSRDGVAVDLTKDHTPKNKDEISRLKEIGAKIEYGTLEGVLSVTRSFGDWQEDTRAKLKGLSAVPEQQKFYVTKDDEFMILACDGLWDVFSSQNAVSFITHFLKKNNDTSAASRAIVQEALRRGTEDNVSVMIIGFGREMPNGDIIIIPSTKEEVERKKREEEQRRAAVNEHKDRVKINFKGLMNLTQALNSVEDVKDTEKKKRDDIVAQRALQERPILFGKSPLALTKSPDSEPSRVVVYRGNGDKKPVGGESAPVTPLKTYKPLKASSGRWVPKWKRNATKKVDPTDVFVDSDDETPVASGMKQSISTPSLSPSKTEHIIHVPHRSMELNAQFSVTIPNPLLTGEKQSMFSEGLVKNVVFSSEPPTPRDLTPSPAAHVRTTSPSVMKKSPLEGPLRVESLTLPQNSMGSDWEQNKTNEQSVLAEIPGVRNKLIRIHSSSRANLRVQSSPHMPNRHDTSS